MNIVLDIKDLDQACARVQDLHRVVKAQAEVLQTSVGQARTLAQDAADRSASSSVAESSDLRQLKRHGAALRRERRAARLQCLVGQLRLVQARIALAVLGTLRGMGRCWSACGGALHRRLPSRRAKGKAR